MKIELPHHGKSIGDKESVFFVAEIGKNFIQSEEDQSVEQYLENAKSLVDAAANAGVDAVKFQTHVVADEVMDVDFRSPHFDGSDRFSWVRRNEMATPLEDFFVPLKKHCDEKGVVFFSTPMSRKAAKKIEAVGVPLWKIGSGDVQDLLLIDYISTTDKPLIISTGMVSLDELDLVVKYITKLSIPLVILYCVSSYPCPPEQFNLATIEYLNEKYPHAVIGFSDHSVDDYDVDLAAIKLGARVIEKHFSWDRDLWGPDHKSSVTPQEMEALISDTRAGKFEEASISNFYGDKNKELEGRDNIHRPYFNKSLVAAHDLNAGTKLTDELVMSMRPTSYIGGINSFSLHRILGRVLKKGIKKYGAIEETNLY